MASEVTRYHDTWFLPPNSLLIERHSDACELKLYSRFLRLCMIDQFIITVKETKILGRNNRTVVWSVAGPISDLSGKGQSILGEA